MPSMNRLAADATTHCLTGCAIGEVLGLVIDSAPRGGHRGRGRHTLGHAKAMEHHAH